MKFALSFLFLVLFYSYGYAQKDTFFESYYTGTDGGYVYKICEQLPNHGFSILGSQHGVNLFGINHSGDSLYYQHLKGATADILESNSSYTTFAVMNPSDIYIFKCDSSGKFVHSKSLPITGTGTVSSVRYRGNGRCMVNRNSTTTNTITCMDTSGNKLWEKDYFPYKAEQIFDISPLGKGYLIVGVYQSSFNVWQLVLISTDDSGKVVKSKMVPSNIKDNYSENHIKAINDSEALVSIDNYLSYNYSWMLKVNTSLDTVWTTKLRSPEFRNQQHIAGFDTINNGEINVLTYNDRFNKLMRLDAKGRIIDSVILDTTKSKVYYGAIITTSDGGYALGGAKYKPSSATAYYYFLKISPLHQVGIAEPNKKPISLLLYPNPAQSNFTIHVPTGFYGKGSLYSLTGQEIKQFDITGNDITLQRDNLSRGIYLISIADGKGGVWQGKVELE